MGGRGSGRLSFSGGNHPRYCRNASRRCHRTRGASLSGIGRPGAVGIIQGQTSIIAMSKKMIISLMATTLKLSTLSGRYQP